MASGARAITLAALVTTLLLAGCGGEDGGNRLSLTDDACTYEGDRSPSATETFEADLVNQSPKLGAFEITRIETGGTFADVESYVDSERKRLEKGLQIAGPPSYLTPGARAQVDAGESGTLVAVVTQGKYVLWCAQEHPPTAVFLITPALDVSE